MFNGKANIINTWLNTGNIMVITSITASCLTKMVGLLLLVTIHSDSYLTNRVSKISGAIASGCLALNDTDYEIYRTVTE